MICYEPWSQLLADAGMSESIPYSRSALTQVASKLEYGPNGFDPRGAYASTAVKGCVDGFLAFLNTNRPAAMP